jgi:large subunit ribosomal protein L10
MDRAQKASSIEELKSVFASSGVVVVTQYSGLTFVEMAELRKRLRSEGAVLMAGSTGDAGSALFKGPVALAYGPDPVTAAKITAQYAKENDKLKLIGAIMGTIVLDESGVKALATLPSLDELRSKLIGLLQAPATKVAGVLQAPAGQLARVLGAYVAKEAA